MIVIAGKQEPSHALAGCEHNKNRNSRYTAEKRASAIKSVNVNISSAGAMDGGLFESFHDSSPPGCKQTPVSGSMAPVQRDRLRVNTRTGPNVNAAESGAGRGPLDRA